MNASDSVITACLGSPIAFHRIFARVAGGAANGLFLSQLWYWHDKGRDPAGWIYKTQQDWESETTLTRREQETARQACRRLGILEEVKRGTPAKLFYRLNVQTLFNAIRAVADGTLTPPPTMPTPPYKDGGNVHPCMAENANLACTKATDKDGGNVPASVAENATLACAKTTVKSGGKRLTITDTTAQTTHKLRIDNNNNAAPPQPQNELEDNVVVEDACFDSGSDSDADTSCQEPGHTAGTPIISIGDILGNPIKSVGQVADAAAKAARVQCGQDTPATAALRAVGVMETKRTNLGDLVARHGEQHVLDLCDAVAKGFVQVDSAAAYLVQKLSGSAPCALPVKYVEDRDNRAARAKNAAKERVIANQCRAIAEEVKNETERNEARWNALASAERATIESEERAAQLASATNEMARRVALGPIGQGDLRRACIARMSTYKNNAAEPLRRTA